MASINPIRATVVPAAPLPCYDWLFLPHFKVTGNKSTNQNSSSKIAKARDAMTAPSEKQEEISGRANPWNLELTLTCQGSIFLCHNMFPLFQR